MKAWDVIIIGGGVIGLTLARELCKRSLSVVVIERAMPGREASHAAAGMLAATPGEMPAVLLPFAAASLGLYAEFVQELQDESGIDVDFRCDGTLLFSDSPPPGASILTSQQVGELEPHVVGGGRSAVFLAEASVDPRALVAAALQAGKHRGIDTSFGDPVKAVNLAGNRVVGVSTTKTTFAAPVVVNCAGAWAGQIGPLQFPTRPVKGQMLSVVTPTRGLLRHVIRTPDVYLVPRSDGRLLIGATLEEAGFDKRVDADTIQRLHRSALAAVPALENARLLEDWAGLRPGTPDALPILGATSVPGYFVATGHFRDGILMTPVTARAMAQLITREACSYNLAPFSADRFPETSAA